MMTQKQPQNQFTPPFCPNSRCPFHFGTKEAFYKKNGFTKTAKPPFLNQRFKCKECAHQFSQNSFSIDYRKKLGALGESVLFYSLNGMSNNSIAKKLKVGEMTVRNRLKTLARQALLFEKTHSTQTIHEDVAYDGFETFTHSQFSPCYVNTAVGSQSLFIYHNTISPLNRKGRMTMEQKRLHLELLKKFGPYPKGSVCEESLYVFSEIAKKQDRRFKLITDEHLAYVKALKILNTNLQHTTVSSKQRRDPSNPLFPVNHLHLLYRHFFCSQKRETIAFQKHEAALLEKIQLMKIYRNFMCTKFVRKNRIDVHAHEWSPAMYLGLTTKVLSFEEVFGMRRLKSQVLLDGREDKFLRREYEYSRQKIAA